jgi:hypothetical protein
MPLPTWLLRPDWYFLELVSSIQIYSISNNLHTAVNLSVVNRAPSHHSDCCSAWSLSASTNPVFNAQCVVAGITVVNHSKVIVFRMLSYPLERRYDI